MSKTKYRFTYDEDWENNETGELASRIAVVLAHRAVDNLMTIAENLTVETMVAITKYLLSMDAERLVSMLKGLFLSHGMYEAAGELDLPAKEGKSIFSYDADSRPALAYERNTEHDRGVTFTRRNTY